MLHGKKKIFLYPGDFVFAGSGVHLHTLLGSCISITLWHPQKKIGGMCHFVLPGYSGERLLNEKANGRYAGDVMELFREAAAEHKTNIMEYQAKIFGGGNMMKSVGDNVDGSVGTKNAGAAMQLLMQEGVEILVAHVGEFGHRRIAFDITTGDVWVKHPSVEGENSAGLHGKA